ncbi:MAG: patatin-like phospholipase family protein [Caldilineaceae bacterium]
MSITNLPDEYERHRTVQIRWMGRPPRRRVGLALGGGAARGIAHIGVLDVLEQHKIPVDCIAGTSADAIAGGMYAAGLSPKRMTELIRKTSWFELASLALPKLGLLNYDRVTQWIEDCLDQYPATFDALKIPFAAVAADIVTGELVAIAEGRIADGMRASSSVPGILSPTDQWSSTRRRRYPQQSACHRGANWVRTTLSPSICCRRGRWWARVRRTCWI